MKSKLVPLLEKEIKDLLRDPRIYIGLIIPILILPLMGFIISLSTEPAMQIMREGIPIVLIDYDKTDWSNDFKKFLSNSGFDITHVQSNEYSEISISNIIKNYKESKIQALIVIPKGFGENITNFDKANVKVYYIIKSAGMGETTILSIIESTIRKYSETLSLKLISYASSDKKPENLKDPITIDNLSIIGEAIFKTHPQAIIGQLTMQSIIIPITLFVVIITVAQIAATATAIENEEKTLETLLTFPINRYEILLAKLVGSTIVAIIGSFLYIFGYYMYLEKMLATFEESAITEMFSLTLVSPPIEAYIILGINILLAILFSTSLGVVIGALSSDVRISNSFLGILIIPIMIPTFLIMYGGDIGALPLIAQIIVYALPTSYPLILTKKMFLGSIPMEAIYGIPYSAMLTFIIIYLTGEFLNPEKLLTLQYKIKIGRLKKKKTII